jgi:hypothetical protein
VRRPFISVHVRAFCHATEDQSKVEIAVRNVVGDIELTSKKTDGHHGNPLVVIEGEAIGSDAAEGVLARLSHDDLTALADTAAQRMDESCNLFLRLDKQKAYGGESVLTRHDDAVSVRIKVSAFPAKMENALLVVRTHLEGVLADGSRPHKPCD